MVGWWYYNESYELVNHLSSVEVEVEGCEVSRR